MMQDACGGRRKKRANHSIFPVHTARAAPAQQESAPIWSSPKHVRHSTHVYIRDRPVDLELRPGKSARRHTNRV